MNMFNDDNELKHPAFHDEIKEKIRWRKIWDALSVILLALVLVAWVLFCIWINYFNTGD
tara:strand:+ start:1526 stop:1702 length:177 start_codon:yes stop_codon:yes gene_type:complete